MNKCRHVVDIATFVVVIIVAVPTSGYAAEPKTWRVVSVHDGDTVRCLDDGNREHKIRLTGIDAPETGQPFGTVSRDHLRQLVLRREVVVHDQGKDKYGRTLARLEVDGKDVAGQMVAEGLAWHYVRYSDDQQLARAEREAKAAARGLWADREPMPPWEWRKAEYERKAAQTR
jgi:endonuclease YncB( thermonuclease family)